MSDKEKELLKDGLMLLIEEACEMEYIIIQCQKGAICCQTCQPACALGLIADHLIEAGVTLPENWLAERDKTP